MSRTKKLCLSVVIVALGLIIALLEQPTQAASMWWDTTTTGLWSSTANWWTTAAGTTNPAVVPTNIDSVTFNGTGILGATTAQIDGATSVLGLSFSNAGTTLLESSTTTSNTLSVGTSGITVFSGAGAVTLGDPVNLMPITFSGGQSWTNNSASLMTVVNIVSTGGNALTISGSGQNVVTGAISGGGGLTISNGTLSISGSSSAFGTLLIGNVGSSTNTPTLNISGGATSFTGGIGFGSAAGARGVLNVSNTATVTVTGGNIIFGGNSGPASNNTASGLINQSGGTFNANITSQVLMPWSNGGYGAYVLSGGTLNVPTAPFVLANFSTNMGLFSQSNGVAAFSNLFQINNGSTRTGVANVSGGILTHKTTGNFMAVGGAGLGVLNVRGSGYVQEQTGNFFVTAAASAKGIVNVLSGGTLEVNQMKSSGGTATVNFDGGTLRAYSTNAGAAFFTGLNNALVYPGGLTVDTNNTNVTIGQTLTAPSGYGIGLSNGMIAVGSGGSGYIAPPIVTFAAPASGVAATGVAVTDATGAVTSIVITSPGSGYTSSQSVAVSFNGGDNTGNEAIVAATSFNVNASTLNTSGGLNEVRAGTLTLSNANAYGGSTTITAGTLAYGANSALPASGAVNVNGGGLDLLNI